MTPEIQLSASETQSLLHKAMPQAQDIKIEKLTQGRVEIRMQYGDWMIRPGNTLSGPAIMTVADSAMYLLILSHYGPQLLAVTSTMNLHFLKKPAKGDLTAVATFKKAGRRLVFCDVDVFTSADPDAVAHVSGTYMIPE